MGMQAGLFVPSGTMGNLAGILAHCQRGDEIIVGNRAHIFLYEAGGISVLGGVHSFQIPNQADGTLHLEDISGAVRWDDPHEPVSRLICLENTQNRCGGTVLTPEYIDTVCEFAHHKGLLVHMDGARIFNAAVALGRNVQELSRSVDSITFCLSKGLCAPVGSILCGSEEFIHRAHRIRKMLGGGMRQAGILAAAGIVALESMITRLEEDHRRARMLAQGLRKNSLIRLENEIPQTNMVIISISARASKSPNEVLSEMKQMGILIDETGPSSFRLVLHHGIEDPDVEKAIRAFHTVLHD
jgi:threonine aldolase